MPPADTGIVFWTRLVVVVILALLASNSLDECRRESEILNVNVSSFVVVCEVVAVRKHVLRPPDDVTVHKTSHNPTLLCGRPSPSPLVYMFSVKAAGKATTNDHEFFRQQYYQRDCRVWR